MSTSDLELTRHFEPPTREAWLKLVTKALKGGDFEKRLVSRTLDGLRIEPLYTSEHARKAAGAVPLSPATAGGRWEIRQLTVEPDPAAANTVVLEDLAAGAAGIALAIEAAGKAGLVADAPALGAALQGVPLDRVTVAFDAGDSAIAAAEAMASVWQAAGTRRGERRAAFNVDPIGTLARLGGSGSTAEAGLAAAARLAADARWNGERITVLLADGRPCHEAGGSEAQELGFMLASAIAYLRAGEAAGLAPAAALGRMGFALATDTDQFLSIAKLRAARLLISRLAIASGAGEAAARARIWASTSERMMARRDPWVNLLRTCTAGLAAAVGGADSITIHPFSWSIGRPDAFARRIARNMHVVLAEESHLGRVGDPARGVWHIEALTEDLARAGWAEMQAIEAAGGIVAALRSGFVRERVGRVVAERAKSLASGRSALTGVSAFPRLGDDGVKVAPHHEPRAPAGTAETVAALAPMRLAAAFEDLRDRADAAAARSGREPSVFLASLGTLADHSARTTWIANFLAAGGIRAVTCEGFTNSADAGKAFAESGASVACLCSSDEVYATLGEATASLLKQVGARRVFLAGRPKDAAALEAAGVDGFLYAGQDALAALASLHGDLGIA